MTVTKGDEAGQLWRVDASLHAILLDNASDPIFCFDSAGTYLYINNAFAAPFNKQPGDIIGKRIWDIFPGEEGDRRFAAVKDVFATGEKKIIEVKVQTETVLQYYTTSVIPVKNDDGEVYLVICISKDITEYKHVENALRLLHRQLFDIIDFLPDATSGIDCDRRIIIWNKAMEKMTGIPAAEMMGKGDYAYTVPFYGERRPQLMDLVFLDDAEIATKYSHLVREGQTLEGEAYCPALYQGQGAWLYVKASPLHDQDGKVIGAIESIRDITESKQAEITLRESENRYHELVELALDGILHGSPQGVVIEANQYMSELTGLAKNELIGLHISQMPFTEESVRRVPWRFDLLKKGQIVTSEREICRADGSIVFVEMRTKMLPDSTYQSIFHDITQRKLAEAKLIENQRRLLEAQTIAHVGDWELELSTQLVWLSKEAANIFGYALGTQQFAFADVQQLVHEEDREALAKASKVSLVTGCDYDQQYRIRRHDNGEIRHVQSRAKLIKDPDGGVVKVVGTIQDITDYKKSEEEIVFLSYHDQLTGLYNRRFYEEELARLDKPRNLPLTIAMGDVNGLKLVNDSFGHAMGDELLRKVGEIIKKGCRADDIVARWGGDEFVIILPKTDGAQADLIIKRISELAAIEKAGSIDISISFGYETKTRPEESVDEILKDTEDHMYRHKLYESASVRSKTINLIMNTLYEKSNREMLHSLRVGELCEAIAVKMNFDKDAVNQIKVAGLMHDIGKIGIDEKILNKPGRLEDFEMEEIKRHSEIGYRILSSVNEFSDIAKYVLEHQERWDGQGYPRGLKATDISLQSRIIAVADAYDAMNSDRTYRGRISEDKAIKEIKEHAGTQFDPLIAKVFVEKVLGKDW
jgi:diguanylate cyclase (GGDEF)-like protein/PAS domain S-box-containing protein/putative nucleotidyltransferase with HDIG domain